MDKLVRAELHCHTRFSKDSLTEIQDLVNTCRKKGIQRLAITDHNTIEGALQAYQLAPDLVIVGEEVMTQRGELLAFFMTKAIPRGLEPEKAITLLHEQGAFISVSHPFDAVRNGAWKLEDLEKIASQVDAIETFNSRCSSSRVNQQALDFARNHGLAGTAGSDAHTLWEVGKATLTLEAFSNAAELRKVLGKARGDLVLSPFYVHIASSYARMYKQFKKLPS
jgi:predicted metal-dependent phosphoesterase TrpH